jgi:hypothetical protein
MLASVLLSTWVLLVTATTTQCQGVECRLVRSAGLAQHQAATFPTQAACEAFRRELPPIAPMVIEWDAPRPLRVMKQMTSTCQPRKDGP